jgi:hypothetical protein
MFDLMNFETLLFFITDPVPKKASAFVPEQDSLMVARKVRTQAID